jgi:uncharacterized protein (TIGR02271 family)
MMAYEKIVAVYDRAEKASEAANALKASGFPAGDISLLNRDSLKNAQLQEAGLWRRLFGPNIGDHESSIYGRTIEAGGAVLTLRLPYGDVTRAIKVLDVHSPVDMSERTDSLDAPTPSTTKSVAKEEVLRLAEEQLDVSKRMVETGRARIRRFVIEKPVESQVTLHEEHAEMVRRAVSDPELDRDVDWADKTIEVTETAEQAVVTKTAHLAEEVVIRREGSDHVETVRDKVRRQEVELERLPRDTRKAG